MSKHRQTLSILLKITVAVVLITYLVKSGHLDPKDLWNLMTFPHVAMALGLVGLNLVLAAWRWLLLLEARDFHIPFGYGLGLYLIGIFFNHALPGAVGGDLVRGYYLVADYPDRRMDSVLSVAIDRILGLYSFFILTLIAVAWDYDFVMGHEQIRWIAVMCFLIFAGMTAFFTVVFSQRLSKAFGLHFFESRIAVVHKLVVSLHRFGQNRKVIAISVAVSLLAQLMTMFFFYELAQFAGEPGVTWNSVMFAVPMGFLVTAIPIAPAGVGVGQVAFLYLFSTYLQRQTQFGAMSITAYQLTIASWGLVGAVLYMRRRKPQDLAAMQSMAQ
jgi:uncharacterized protein (TIRG00374 family)